MNSGTADKAHQEASRLVKRGQHEQASYYFVNALSRNPGDLGLIEDFVASLRSQAQAAVKENQAERTYDLLDRAVSLLYERVPSVTAEDLPRLLELAEQLVQERDALVVAPPAEEDPRDIQARNDLKLLQTGKLDTSDKGTAEDLQARIERLRTVLQFVTSGGQAEGTDKVPWKFSLRADKAKQIELRGDFQEGGWEQGVKLKKADGIWSVVVPMPVDREIRYNLIVDDRWQHDPDNPEKDATGDNSLLRSISYAGWLERTIGQLEMALQFEMMHADGLRLLEEARKKQSQAAAALCLQGAEQVARQLATWTAPGERQDRVGKFLDDLRVEGDKLAEASKKLDSEAAWQQFSKEVALPLAEARSWTSKTKSWASGHMQKQIERLQLTMRSLQEVAARLTSPQTSQNVRNLADELGKLMTQAVQAQQKEYNGWAMERLELMMMNGDEHIGIRDKEELLGDCMLEHLGPIDVRLLTQEVNRCYSEVFEHFFSHLDKPHDEKDFGKRGHKLWLLKKLFEHEKKQLSYF